MTATFVPAYHGDEKLKAIMLEEMAEHRKADCLIKGTYGKMNGKFKGCAVGCGVHSLNVRLKKTIKTDDHAAYAKTLGIPTWLAYLEDGIFEGLPEKESQKWPERFLKAIKPGANLEPVRFQLMHWILAKSGLLEITGDNKAAIAQCAELHCRAADGDMPSDGEWSAAWSAARSAAWNAAENAAQNAAWSAAWSAAENAAWSAARNAAQNAAWSAARNAAQNAARSAAWSAAWNAAQNAAFTKIADATITFLKAAK